MFTGVEQETYLKAPKIRSPNYSGIACVHVPKQRRKIRVLSERLLHILNRMSNGIFSKVQVWRRALFHQRPSWFQTLAGWGDSEFGSSTRPAPITDHWVPARWVIDWSLETRGFFGLECTHDSRQEVMLECYRKCSQRRFECCLWLKQAFPAKTTRKRV